MAYETLADFTLANGETAELGVVTAPCLPWKERLCRFLNSPPQPERASLYDFLLSEELPGLRTSFFVVRCEEDIVGCMVTTDAANTGYINSTFVNRGHRQLGVATAFMAASEGDFEARGGRVRMLTTRTGSPADTMFRKFGYQTVYEGGGRTGMEKHHGGHTWEAHFAVDPQELRLQDMGWAQWCPHRALHWNRNVYRALSANFDARLREVLGEGRGVWKGLLAADGRLLGDAVLRPCDRWSGRPGARKAGADEQAYALDLHVHPGCASRAAELYDAVMPSRGQVRTFLQGADRDAAAFLLDRGFRLETSLRDDFNHHDPTTLDIRVYGRSLPGRVR